MVGREWVRSDGKMEGVELLAERSRDRDFVLL